MSFFGFDTTLPRDSKKPQPDQSTSLGIFEQHDPFAGLNRDGAGNDEGDMLNFEDTYDGLGHQLDESGDTFNDDTFGGDEPVTREDVGRDFDFAGQTARMRGELLGEQAYQQQMPSRQQYAQPPSQYVQPTTRPKRTGYEAYKEPEYIPKLEADASIWGTAIGGKKPAAAAVEQPHARQESSTMGRKMMSLEEVEAMMRAPSSKPTPSPVPELDRQSQGLRDMLGVGVGVGSTPSPAPGSTSQEQPRPVQILQRPQQQPQQQMPAEPQMPPPQQQQSMPDYNLRAPQILQRQHSPQQPGPRQQSLDFQGQQPPYPMPSQQPMPVPMPMGAPPVQQPSHTHHRNQSSQHMSHARGPSYTGPPITAAQQLLSLAPSDREAYLAEEAKRAKRNHKIFLLSKNNGLMTPQDKNFITRIQLQQLLTATGGVDNEPGSEEQLAEDFYYQVYAQIRGPAIPRGAGGAGGAGGGGAAGQFAQTYLFQTGSRYGYGRSRHHPRGGGQGGADNHVQRMEQQVARAVEAAKARPKNKSLVVEGSLGKIAFSNSKTPRPLLNIKRPDSVGAGLEGKVRRHTISVADRKAALRDLENVYAVLMRLEDHERRLPPPPNEESPPDVIERHMRWRSEMQALNQELWEKGKVMEAIQPNPSSPHPFIQLLTHSKGKKALPRIFRHLDDQQRLTLLTLLIIHLDVLDVVRDAYPASDPATPIPQRTKDEIELFSNAVMPPLFSYVNEAPLGIIIGLLGLVLERTNVHVVVRTKIGLSVLTMLVSRAELVAQVPAGGNAPTQGGQQAQADQEDRRQWGEVYNRLFDAVEPVLPVIFPPSNTTSTADSAAAAPAATQGTSTEADDVYVWQFLAAMGVGASPDQQQRLVLGVKERVMETVTLSRAVGVPAEVRERRLADVNLFMRAIGLDVELLS